MQPLITGLEGPSNPAPVTRVWGSVTRVQV